MGIYINFVCNHEGCRTLQPAGFDGPNETWGEMLEYFEKIGWTIEDKNSSMTSKVYCPVHSTKKKE